MFILHALFINYGNNIFNKDRYESKDTLYVCYRDELDDQAFFTMHLYFSLFFKVNLSIA